jgi:GT2 family glycosyltransferase
MMSQPKISVIVLNYNGAGWLPRCFGSLEQQTIFSELEIVLTDNNSTDDSVALTEAWLARSGAKGRVVQNGANLYYCGANNNGAAAATGKYFLFLNNDTWLEPDCLEQLYNEVEQAKADAATPLVLNYDDNSVQNWGASGLDIFGMTTTLGPVETTTEEFASCGCSLLVKAEMFRKIGGFAAELLIYADETDICWRVWIAGGRAVVVPQARLHHRGAAVANPAGGSKQVEQRTTDTKRFLANRNGLLMIAKNAQHILLPMLAAQLVLLTAEAVASLMIVRRWSHVRKAYIGGVAAAFRMWPHVREWRRKISGFRQRSDFWMLRFLRLVPYRLVEVKNLLKLGPPKIDAK